tara:strand:+ start:1939 stop:2412 length:474 start_codon:yes stop_codon:yes gene_type:complete
MARITVEDCLKKIDSQYDLVLLAKERTAQLNAGDLPLVPKDNDKNTVISLREIGEGKVSIKTLEDSAINKLRKVQEASSNLEEIEDEQEDSFDKIYKGEVSKSGTAILPSKRVRRIPDKIEFSAKKEEEKIEEDDESKVESNDSENQESQNLEEKTE